MFFLLGKHRRVVRKSEISLRIAFDILRRNFKGTFFLFRHVSVKNCRGRKKCSASSVQSTFLIELLPETFLRESYFNSGDLYELIAHIQTTLFVHAFVQEVANFTTSSCLDFLDKFVVDLLL